MSRIRLGLLPLLLTTFVAASPRASSSAELDAPTKQELQLIQELRTDTREVLDERSTATQPWFEHEKELIERILNDDPRDFLHWGVIRNTMFHFPKSVELRTLQASPHWITWQKALEEDRIGNPDGYFLYPASSGNLIHHAYHLQLLLDGTNFDVDGAKRVFEFGGGYGSFCRMMYRYGFDGHYVLFDLPAFLMLQKYFLKSTGLPVTVTKEMGGGRNTVSILSEEHVFRSPASFKGFDLFIGLWSVSEVPVELRDRIFPLFEDTKYFLIAYQESYAGIDNVEYFSNLQKARPDVDWMDFAIQHLPGSRYLIGAAR